MGIPVFTPGSTTSGSCPRHWRESVTTTDVSGGTTLARATPAIWPTSTPEAANRLRTRIPYSSAVCSRRVVRRQWALSSSPSCTPRTVLVLPTSMVRSRGMVLSLARGPHLANLAGMQDGPGAVLQLQDEGAAFVQAARDAAQPARARARLHGTAPPGQCARAPGGLHDLGTSAREGMIPDAQARGGRGRPEQDGDVEVPGGRDPALPVTAAAGRLRVGQDDGPGGRAFARAQLEPIARGGEHGGVLDLTRPLPSLGQEERPQPRRAQRTGRGRRIVRGHSAPSTSSEMSTAGAECVSAPTAM